MARVFPEKSCGCLIVRHVGGRPHVLLVQSASHRHWTFPKGHMEDAETEHETARREVMEETGLTVDIAGAFRHTMHYQTRRGSDKEVVYFLSFAENPVVRVQPEEIASFRWLPLDGAEQALTFDRDKDALRHLIRHLGETIG